MRTSNYGLFIHTKRPFELALEAVKDALKVEGFGVLADIALGLLITKVMTHVWPLTAEDSVNRELERDRTHDISVFSLIFSTLASTPAIISVV